MKNWFLPETPDLLGALQAQAAITLEGLQHFWQWSMDASPSDLVVEHEHQADVAKRKVQEGLRIAFSTPLDPEDIYELSERIDAVMNAAKNTVREAEVIAMLPDAHIAAMAEQLALAMAQVCTGVAALNVDDDRATASADLAVKTCHQLERHYRTAMSELLAVPDVREVMGRRELYRRCARTGEAVQAVADRIWYAVVKSP